MILTASFVVVVTGRPAAATAEWFDALPKGDPGSFFAGETRKLSLANETRNAVALGSEARRASVDLAAGVHRLSLAAALACPPRIGCLGGAVFRIVAPSSAGNTVLYERRLDAATQGRRWVPVEVDLQGLEAPVRLEFVAEPLPGLTALPVWSEPIARTRKPTQRPNVILISLDTLRADRLGSYGYARPTSPNIDEIARQGARFELAFAQAPWTTPSHMSLFTSLYPSAHGLNQSLDYFDGFSNGFGRFRRLPAERVTMAEVFQAHGYDTLGLVGGGTVAGALGFSQGFDIYREGAFKLTEPVWETLDRWLGSQGESPFFLFFHTFEVHSPYTELEFAKDLLTPSQRQDLEQMFAEIRKPGFNFTKLRTELMQYLADQGLMRKEITGALYDGGIVVADRFIGRLVGRLKELGVYDRTVLVLTSDHGEEFGDHSEDRVYDAHCATLYDELTRVPLIVRYPGIVPESQTVTEQVELIDVAPTLLDLLGIDIPGQMVGESFAKSLRGEAWASDGRAVSESVCLGPEWKALRTPQYKLIAVGAGDGDRSGFPDRVAREELYDLESDPREQQSVLAAHPGIASDLRKQLRSELASDGQAEPADAAVIDDALMERLRALGYVE